MSNKIKFFLLCAGYVSAMHGMIEEKSVKKIFDHKQQQFVKVQSLVDRSADVYVAWHLVPMCQELSGTNIDTVGNEIITKQLYKLPDELRPLIITKLLPHAIKLGWNIRFREKSKKEAQYREKILYSDENCCVKQKKFWKKIDGNFDHANIVFIDKLRAESLSRKLSENLLMHGVCACLVQLKRKISPSIHDLICSFFGRKTQQPSSRLKVTLKHPFMKYGGDIEAPIYYETQLRVVINAIKKKRLTLKGIFKEFYNFSDSKFLTGSSWGSGIVFDTAHFNKIQELDLPDDYRGSSLLIAGKNLIMCPPFLQTGECLMWEYNERENIFRALKSGIYFSDDAYGQSLDYINDVATEQDVLIHYLSINYDRQLIFYQHRENSSDAYWVPIQHIQNQKDIIFSDDKQTCIALQLDCETVDFYQRIENEWRIVSTIKLEKPIARLNKLTSNVLIGQNEYDDNGYNNRYLYFDIKTGKVVLSRFYYCAEEAAITFDLPYEVVLAAIAKSNDYKRHNQKGLKALLSSRALRPGLTNNQLNDYKEQLIDKIETAARRSSVLLRCAKFLHAIGKGKLLWGWFAGHLILIYGCNLELTNPRPSLRLMFLSSAGLRFFLHTSVSLGLHTLSMLPILFIGEMFLLDKINDNRDLNWFLKRKSS